MARRMLVVVVVVSSVRAHAGPVSSDLQTARKYTEAALTASKHDDFETAIDMYEKAYAVTPHVLLLWNLAHAHRRAAEKLHETDPVKSALHRDAARDYFRKFLDTNPDEDMESKTRSWLAKLDAQWAAEYPKEETDRRAEEARKREAAIQVEQVRSAIGRKQKVDRDKLEHERITMAVTRTAIEQELGKARIVKIAGIGGISTGGISIAAGVYFGVKARRISDDLNRDDVFDPKRIEDGNTAQRNMLIAYIAGGALMIGGAVTYCAGWWMGAHALEHATMTVVPASDGAAVAMSGTF